MEFNSKNDFFNLLRQFEVHDELGKVYYCGVQVEQRGTLEVNLQNAFNAFKQEFESNLVNNKENALTYIGVLLTGLDSIESELRFQLRERVTEFRRPITAEEFPDEKERNEANRHMQEQYKANQLPLIEQIVHTQQYYLSQCREYIDLHKTKSLVTAIETAKQKTASSAPASTEIEVPEIVADASSTYLLRFNCNRNELAMLFWLFKKNEFIQMGRNELVSFIETFCVYENDEGKFCKMTSVNSLISSFERVSKNPEPAKKEVIKVMEQCLERLKLDIDDLKSTTFEKA